MADTSRAEPARPDEVVLKQLTASLRSFDRAEREAAIESLCQGGEAAARIVVARLRDNDARVRCAACRVFAGIGTPAVRQVSRVAALLADSDPGVCQAAAEALGAIGEGAVPVATEALGGEVSGQWAARALGIIGAPAAEATAARLCDPSPSVRRDAVDALARIGEGAVPPCQARMADPMPEARQSAAKALGAIGHHAVPALTAGLEHAHETVREATCEAFRCTSAKMDGQESRGGLSTTQVAAFLDAPVASTRMAAARALGRLGAPAAVPHLPELAERLADIDSTVREAAAEALGRIGAPAVRFAAAHIEDPEPSARVAAITALGRAGRPAAPYIQTLVALHGNRREDARVRAAAGDAAAAFRSHQSMAASAATGAV